MNPLLFLLLAAAVLAGAEPRAIPGLGITMMPIPAGSFIMGSPEVEAGRNNSEGPQTRVTISRPYWLARCEVTHAQWRQVTGRGLEEQARLMLQDDTLYALDRKQQTLRDYHGGCRDCDPREMLYDTHPDVPICMVDWREAEAFCRKIDEQERTAGRVPPGYEYRLPTEAEWEYACRAGTTTATYAGDLVILGRENAPVLDAIAWYVGNSAVGFSAERGSSTKEWTQRQYPVGDKAGPRVVGTKKPNAWGLHDMLGNVNEWCADWYVPALPGGSVIDPRGPATGTLKVLRGGSWSRIVRGVRAANRSGHPPTYRSRCNLGIRLALGPVLGEFPASGR